MSPAPMVHLRGIRKQFGPRAALRGIDLDLPRGRCLGLFGPNGAGKTTLLRILATLLRPSAGTGQIAGYDLVREAAHVRPLLGVVSHRTFLFGALTAAENLHLYGRLLGVPHLAVRIAAVLDAVALGPYAQQAVRTYSRGMQQRLALARALLHAPPVLLLAQLLYLLGVGLGTVGLCGLWFQLDVRAGGAPLGVALLLGLFGLSIVGSVLGLLAGQTRGGEVVLPLLVLPLTVPVTIAAVQATTHALAGQGWGASADALVLLGGFDVIFFVVVFLVFDWVVEE